MQAFIARVVSNDEYPDEDCIDVVFIRESMMKAKVHVLHDRANPLYGRSGYLPDVGETGIVIRVSDFGDTYYWLGSFHDPCDNICTKNTFEVGRDLYHHQSDVWHQILKDGTVEFSHPSGTFIKLGSGTTLNSRTRFQKLPKLYNQKAENPYPNRGETPVALTINHTWLNGGASQQTYAIDKRKQHHTGDIKTTKLILDAFGGITLDHETATGTHMTLTIDNAGNVAACAPTFNFSGIGGQTAVTINGTLHTTNNILCDTNIKAVAEVYDMNGSQPTFCMSGMRAVYNLHQHADSPPPSPSM